MDDDSDLGKLLAMATTMTVVDLFMYQQTAVAAAYFFRSAMGILEN